MLAKRMYLPKKVWRLMTATLLCFVFPIAILAQPAVQLAKSYADTVDVQDFLISEKYDGVRAIWTGSELLSRTGKPIHAPTWFTDVLPNHWLDGELWAKRGAFQFVASVVAKQEPDEKEWRQVRYMIFDAPDYDHTFQVRSQRYQQIVAEIDSPFVIAIKQFTVVDNKQLSAVLERYVAKGAEGLILHRKNALFANGRTDNVLKLKPYMDAEATVVGITAGKGKYTGMMGALIVVTPSGLRFKIGSGFSDVQRAAPPNIGDIITYQYHGYTNKGIPRFASFMRVRYLAKPFP